MSDTPQLFEEIVYRGYGPHQRKGGGFSSLGVKSEAELEAALADGWYRTLAEAIDAHDNPKSSAPKLAAVTIEPKKTEDNAAPSRAEIEQKAKELGIVFHPKISDANLIKKIDEKLAA